MTTIIVIEGPDQVGKATQTKLLAHSLRKKGHTVAEVEVPFKDSLTHPLIYSMLRSGTAKKHPNLFQFVQFLNKLIFQIFFLLPLMMVTDYVVLDRWSISSIVYGDATGVNPTFNRFLFWFLKKADYTFILMGQTYKRSGEQDVYEQDSELQSVVKNGYIKWANEHLERHHIILNDASKIDVHERIIGFIPEVN